jgi:hypothetical protein
MVKNIIVKIKWSIVLQRWCLCFEGGGWTFPVDIVNYKKVDLTIGLKTKMIELTAEEECVNLNNGYEIIEGG